MRLTMRFFAFTCLCMQDENITIRVSKDWLARIDAWRKAQDFPPSRSEVIRTAVDRLLVKDRRMEK
jgi:Arc/MetJ-type ribon-helix-helix transcriptional regulator